MPRGKNRRHGGRHTPTMLVEKLFHPVESQVKSVSPVSTITRRRIAPVSGLDSLPMRILSAPAVSVYTAAGRHALASRGDVPYLPALTVPHTLA